MLARSVHLCIIFFLVSLKTYGVWCNNLCSSFEVQLVITAAENENVTIPFNLNVTKGCIAPERFFLRVSNGIRVQCSLLHYKWKCQQPVNSPKCTCKTKNKPYEFVHTVHRSDNPPAIWTWFTDGGNTQNLSVTFNVTYPAQANNLSFKADNALVTSTVNPIKSLDIVCAYDAGNPPVAFYLRDRHGAILQTVNDVPGEIRYRFAAVDCQDAGRIRCQGPEASHKSTPLLFQCEPNITINRSKENVGGTVSVELKVRSHTSNLPCKIQNSDAVCNVSLTPPDLTVRVNNVKNQDPRTWLLTLANDEGDGNHISLLPTATEGSSADSGRNGDTGAKSHETGENVTNTLAVVTGVLAFIAIIITITLCVIVIYRFRMFTAFQGRFVFRNGPVNPRNINVGLPPPQPAPQNNLPPIAVYVCHADDEPEIVFEPANEEARDRGPPPGMNQCATSAKNALNGDSLETVGKPRQQLFLHLNGASPFVLDTDGASASTSDAGAINGPDGKPEDPPKPCTYTESADDATYVPISDILAKKRRKDVAAKDVAAKDVASKDGQADDNANVSVTMELATHSVSYSSLNFDRRPPITAPRLSSRPSCFYTRLADMDTDTDSSPPTHDDPERDK